MIGAKHWSRSLILLIWSVLLTGLTGLFGLAPLRVVRYQMGALPFLLTSFGLSVLFLGMKLPGLSILFLIVSIVAAVMAEAERGGFSRSVTGAIGVIGGALATTLCANYWIKMIGSTWPTVVKARIDEQITRIVGANANLLNGVTSEELFKQIPSVLAIGIIVMVAVGMILEGPVFQWAGIKPQNKTRLVNFRLPDATIWLGILSLLFSFVEMNMPIAQVAAQNFLNILAVLFFLQGLAVLCKYFEVFKVSNFWRTLWLVIFITQLFLVLSFIGFVDYWADFRSFFLRKAGEVMKRSKP